MICSETSTKTRVGQGYTEEKFKFDHPFPLGELLKI